MYKYIQKILKNDAKYQKKLIKSPDQKLIDK